MTGRFRVVVVILLAASFARAATRAAAAVPPATGPAAPAFKYISVVIVLDENNLPKRLSRTDIYFVGDTALAVDADGLPEWTFDLRRQTIADEHGGGRQNLAQMQAQAQKQRAEKLKQLPDMKDQATAQRMKCELDPALATLQSDDGKLIVSNPIIRYEIDPSPLDPAYRQRLYAAVRLSAYSKSTASVPPFLNLALADELERRGVLAKEMKITHQQSDGPVEMRVLCRVMPLSDQDRKRLAPLFLPGAGF